MGTAFGALLHALHLQAYVSLGTAYTRIVGGLTIGWISDAILYALNLYADGGLAVAYAQIVGGLNRGKDKPL